MLVHIYEKIKSRKIWVQAFRMVKVSIWHNCFFAMNTRFEAVFWGHDRSIFEAAFVKIKQTVLALEKKLSRFIPASEIYQLNHSGRNTTQYLSNYLYHVIQRCVQYHKKTVGYFDITSKIIHNTASQKNSADDLFNGAGNIRMNAHNKTVCFRNRETIVDFGGIGKGLALEAVEEILGSFHIKNGFISFGESSVITRGHHPHGKYWPFGIADMFNPAEIVHTFNCTNDAVSTSASIQRMENQKEAKYHIVNPKSGSCVKTPKMISVKSESPVTAEVLSTALLAADSNARQEVIANFEPVEAVEVTYHPDNSPIINRLI